MNIEQKSGSALDLTATFRLTPRELRSAVRWLPAVRRMLLLSPLILLTGLVVSWSDSEPSWYPLVFGVVLPILTEVGVVRGAARRSAPLLAEPWYRPF